MRDRYSFTGDGLHNMAVYGINPAEPLTAQGPGVVRECPL
jgi:hypothetical protein